MGRWVTSKGRRIYIPDEGEKVPEKYKKNTVNKSKYTVTAAGKEMKSFDTPGEADDYIAKQIKSGNGVPSDWNVKHNGKSGVWEEENIKEKQIAINKAQADERNGKIRPYYVDQEAQILGEKMSSRGMMIYAKSEEEALSQYKKEYPKGNARIKESKYPEHIKRAQELNKKQTDKRNKKIEKQEALDTYYQKSLELSMRADDPRYKERLRKRRKDK